MIHIIIPGTPVSVNHYLGNCVQGRRVVRYKTKKAKDYQKLCSTLYDHKTLDGDLKMTIHLYFGDKRRRDVDNYNKSILDAFQGYIYKDDSQIKELTIIKKEKDKENPRVEVFVEAL